VPDFLVVPVRVDALFLREETGAVATAPDFTALPHVDPATGRDVHGEMPYLSEVILPEPFQDEGLRLRPGIHLHWTLPDALTRLVQRNGVTEIPSAPNRWLVTRSRDGTVEAQWVVESDHLSDDGPGIDYPVTSGTRPYRRLGRAVPLSAWPTASTGQNLGKLTVVGYGEPAFAACYTNCHSVFGLHDPAQTTDPTPDLRYDVLGWYADPAQDPVAAYASVPDWQSRIGTDQGWSVPKGANRPTGTLFYAQLTFQPDAQPAPAADGTGVYVGTTATEALAAYLGDKLPGTAGDEIENLLEALAFAEDLEARTLDLGAKLAEARHGDTFDPLPPGTLHTIRRQDGTPPPPAAAPPSTHPPGQASPPSARPPGHQEPPSAQTPGHQEPPSTQPPGHQEPPSVLPPVTAEQRQARERLKLPADLGDGLHVLNLAQDAYERRLRLKAGLRQQLFADWYKYMLCAYPYEGDRDAFPDPDEVRFFLEREIARIDTVPETGVDDTLAALRAAVAAFNQGAPAAAKSAYAIQQVAAPLYYQPGEPVVLLTGPAATPSSRYGYDGELTCAVVTATGDTTTAAGVTALRAAAAPMADPQATNVWQRQPWHPVLLQWEAEFYPIGPGANLDPRERRYAPTYITDNYELPGDGCELTLKPGRAVPRSAANVYTGTTVLVPSARSVLTARVLRYLQGTVRRPTTTVAAFQANPDPDLDAYLVNGTEPRLKTLIGMYRELIGDQGSNLSQALSGFNEGLLMRRMVRQLPVDDPLGFPDYQAFTARVAQALGKEARHAPQPLTGFNPIRAGAMRVRRLRVIDSFGTYRDVDTTAVTATSRLRVPGEAGWVALAPRLTQPARLGFRWLDSDHDLRESNAVPETSPVCGWLVPDHLAGGVDVYTADGVLLGRLATFPDRADDKHARWSPAPGGTITAVAGIPQPHLRQVVTTLQGYGPAGLADWLASVETTLETIEPAATAARRDQNVLTGRPLAVVRAVLTLELMGPPAVHQDWNVFRQDLRRTTRESDGFPQVRFPVRVGEHGQLDDGLVGFWTEDGGTAFQPTATTVELGIELPAQTLTMVLDPHGSCHATSGILPTKAISVPPEHYADALAGMEVDFRVAPILGDAAKTAVPVPAEPGYVWTWRQRSGAGWAPDVVPAVPPLHADFPAQPTAREGWLALRPAPEETS
jgi:hypothetical protein